MNLYSESITLLYTMFSGNNLKIFNFVCTLLQTLVNNQMLCTYNPKSTIHVQYKGRVFFGVFIGFIAQYQRFIYVHSDSVCLLASLFLGGFSGLWYKWYLFIDWTGLTKQTYLLGKCNTKMFMKKQYKEHSQIYYYTVF